MSKFDKTVVPLMATLNTLDPVVEKYVSAKCRRTVDVLPAVKPGMVYVKLPTRAV
jgi:hypothetical protein